MSGSFIFMLPISGGGIFTSGLYKSLLRYDGETFFFPPVFFFVRESMMKPRNNTRT